LKHKLNVKFKERGRTAQKVTYGLSRQQKSSN